MMMGGMEGMEMIINFEGRLACIIFRFEARSLGESGTYMEIDSAGGLWKPHLLHCIGVTIFERRKVFSISVGSI